MAKKSLEENFRQLEEITSRMEDKDLSLEDMFKYYKAGMELIRESTAMIDTMEKEISVINEQGDISETL